MSQHTTHETEIMADGTVKDGNRRVLKDNQPWEKQDTDKEGSQHMTHEREPLTMRRFGKDEDKANQIISLHLGQVIISWPCHTDQLAIQVVQGDSNIKTVKASQMALSASQIISLLFGQVIISWPCYTD